MKRIIVLGVLLIVSCRMLAQNVVFFQELMYQPHLYNSSIYTFFELSKINSDATVIYKYDSKKPFKYYIHQISSYDLSLMNEYLITFGKPLNRQSQRYHNSVPCLIIGMESSPNMTKAKRVNYFYFYSWNEVIAFYNQFLEWLEMKKGTNSLIQYFKTDLKEYKKRQQLLHKLIENNFQFEIYNDISEVKEMEE